MFTYPVHVFCHVYNFKTIHKIVVRFLESLHNHKFDWHISYKIRKTVIRLFENRAPGY